MKIRFFDFYERTDKITKLIIEPAEFERKFRKLFNKKISEDKMFFQLMNENILIKFNCDVKKYLCDFGKIYIETKDKITKEEKNDDDKNSL